MNVELYDLLKETEVHIFENYFKDIEILAFIDFYDLKNFIDAAGIYWFEDDGINSQIREDCICVDILEILQAEGGISSYRRCFDENEWRKVESKISKKEELV